MREEDSSLDEVMGLMSCDSRESLDRRLVDFRHAEFDHQFIVIDAFVRGALDIPRIDDVFVRLIVDGRVGDGRQRFRNRRHRYVHSST